MSNIEKIRAEIERLYGEYKDKFHRSGDSYHLGLIDGLDMAERVLDTFSEEPATNGYDEAYLNEKIAKASKTWEGVDVDKYMDEVRDREPDKSLEEAAEEYLQKVKAGFLRTLDHPTAKDCFIHGAEWQEKQFEKNRLAHCDALSKEDYDRETDFAMEIIEKEHRQPTFIDAINYGMRLQKEQIITLIQSRIGEILGDAQPKPALRAELRELIENIKEDEE